MSDGNRGGKTGPQSKWLLLWDFGIAAGILMIVLGIVVAANG